MPRNSKLKRQIDEMVGANIERLRKKHGHEPKDLARALGVTPGMIRLYERGERGLNIAQLVWFANLFRVNLDEMVWGEEKAPRIMPFHKLRVG